jgi:hypothetical protein
MFGWLKDKFEKENQGLLMQNTVATSVMIGIVDSVIQPNVGLEMLESLGEIGAANGELISRVLDSGFPLTADEVETALELNMGLRRIHDMLPGERTGFDKSYVSERTWEQAMPYFREILAQL